MEIKINILNLEDAKNNLNNLDNQLNIKDFPVSDTIVLIRESLGGTCDEVNESYRSLKRIELALSKLIKTTQICVNNGKFLASETDKGIANVFEQSYSGYSLGNNFNIGNNHLLSK